MFIPKWLLSNILAQLDENDKRIRRLENIAINNIRYREKIIKEETENTKKEITVLRGDKDGNNRFSTTKEIIDKSIEV